MRDRELLSLKHHGSRELPRHTDRPSSELKRDLPNEQAHILIA